jgi:hypothetical protein
MCESFGKGRYLAFRFIIDQAAPVIYRNLVNSGYEILPPTNIAGETHGQ